MIEIITLSGTLFLASFLFAVSMTATPGPNNIMLLTSSLNFGARQTIPHGLGIICGVPLMVSATGLGLGQLFVIFPVLHQVIKVLGISYLLYLSWKIVMSNTQLKPRNVAKPLSFIQAVLFQWVNPKAWVMAIGAVSAFTTVGTKVPTEIAVISFAFLLAAITSTTIWVFCGVLLTQLLTNPRQRKIFNIVMGLLLVATVLPMLSSAL
jgi:threonine/homoserine/homoserine lactone efflux protein